MHQVGAHPLFFVDNLIMFKIRLVCRCMQMLELKYRDYLSRQVVVRFTFDVVLLKAQREMAKTADFDENRGF